MGLSTPATGSLAEESDLEKVMQLFIKIIPLRAGTAEPAGQPRIVACPAGVEPDTMLSFLTQQLGEVTETIWTSTERHERIDTSWVFPAPAGLRDAVDIACVPLIRTADGLRPMLEVQADQPRAFGQLAASQGMDYTIIQRSQRAYQPARRVTAEPRDQQAPSDDLDHALADIARQAEAMLTSYPRPGAVARRIVLQVAGRGASRDGPGTDGDHGPARRRGRQPS